MKVSRKHIFPPLKEYSKASRDCLTGFTLIEMVVVVVVIGILAAVVFPEYTRSREHSIDKQAQAILKLIRAAQGSYAMKLGDYYPFSGSEGSVSLINSNLKLDLADNGEWSYAVEDLAPGFQATLTRNRGGYNRSWLINNSNENATCTFISGPNNWCP
jgi:type IV pilus assembly protein PilE